MLNKLLSSFNDVFHRSFKILALFILLWSSFCFTEIVWVDLSWVGNMSGNVGAWVVCGQTVYLEVEFCHYLFVRPLVHNVAPLALFLSRYTSVLLWCSLKQYASVCKNSQNKLGHTRCPRLFPSRPCHGTCGRVKCRTFLGTSAVSKWCFWRPMEACIVIGITP